MHNFLSTAALGGFLMHDKGLDAALAAISELSVAKLQGGAAALVPHSRHFRLNASAACKGQAAAHEPYTTKGPAAEQDPKAAPPPTAARWPAGR